MGRSNASARAAAARAGAEGSWKSACAVLLASAALLGGAVGSVHGIRWVRAQVGQQDRFRLPLREIEITPPPRWIRDDLLGQIQLRAGLPDAVHTLDPQLARQLHENFAMHPWIREVIEVRITPPASIRVKLAYREPVGVVRTPRGLEPVDRDGYTLPADGLVDPQIYLAISGVQSTPTGPAGTQWEDPSVLAGAATADALALHHRKLGVSAVDVSAAESGAIYLLTEQGTRIKWGRPPGPQYPGEVPVQDKIDRLLQYVEAHGSLDAPAGPYEIDVTHWQEMSIRLRGPVPN